MRRFIEGLILNDTFGKRLKLTLAIILAGCAARAADWNQNLYLGRGDYWRQRIAIAVANSSPREVSGKPLDIRVGSGDGEAALAGANADALRVCDANGAEMLWSLRGADGKQIRKGTIPAGATLTVPVECAASAGALLFAYFDNPSAWAVPDFLSAPGGLRNGNLELGEGGNPAGWSHDEADEQHKTFWVSEQPHSGTKCLKTVVSDGAEATWISTRQSHIRIEGGAYYAFRAWVRAENVKGNAGWYLHIGNSSNSMMHAPMAIGGAGTYDWKEVKVEFTAPAEADMADIGTVLRGTGTAWFDDVSLEASSHGAVGAHVLNPERLPGIKEIGADSAWPADGDFAKSFARFPVRILNLNEQPVEGGFISANIAGPLARLNGRIDPEKLLVTDDGKPVAVHRIAHTILFPGRIEARSRHTFEIYFAPGAARPAGAESGTKEYAANPALPGGETKEAVSGVVRDEYRKLVESPANLVKNSSFEAGDKLPADWTGAENLRDARVQMGLDSPGFLGSNCLRMIVSTSATRSWRGWHQSIAVKPGRTYLLSSWLKCRDLAGDSLQLHAHALDASGKLCREGGFMSVGPGISGTRDWIPLQGLLTMPRDAARLDLHLTTQASGTAWHDAIVLTEVTPAQIASLESRLPQQTDKPVAWPVNAIVKVFRDDVPDAKYTEARITAARNEREPLQIALRSPRAIANVKVIADAPRGSWGKKLAAPAIGIVGYVPVDHESNYYQTEVPAWHRKFPKHAGACDGWAGWWPDPILPKDSFDLVANETQPVWLTFRVPKDAKPGDYSGTVRFMADGKTVSEIPYTVHVWDFALPEEMHVKAIYDAHGSGPQWKQPGVTQDDARREIWKFMAERRLCPDTVRPEPKIRFRDGKVEADFAEFDAAAAFYFGELKLPHMYTPWLFYGFGWGHPPHKVCGEEPYAGAWPFADANRRVLRPEYKRAYQECLKVFWAHLKERGWDKKCTLYISDEPYDHEKPVRDQMIALCQMIHEVDPAIPIYSSTWHHQPEWDGALTVWGLGHDGRVPVETMEAIRKGGATLWWTTDGMMCTDTPYCGVERLLPHYCFKYGAEAYEFWGIDWLTYDPYEFGWHSYNFQSGEPGHTEWVRFPNGDGFLIYPGAKFGQRAPVPSVRVEQAGEGCEDYEYLWLLRDRIATAKKSGRDVAAAESALADAQNLVTIPNAGGRYSTRILPDPDAVFRVKEKVAQAIESLR